MSILTQVAPRVQAKSTPADPWTEKPAYDVPVASLVFGARVRHKVIPGVWKVVREATRLDSTRRYHVRVREVAENGSLFGPVLSWRIDEVAGLVTDEPKAEPAGVIDEGDIITLINYAPPADEPRPLVVAMVISIDGTHYSVTPLAPAPDAVKAFRFSKVGGDGREYDVEELSGGARCDCGDFVFRREGLAGVGCKHIRGAWMMGLIAEYGTAPTLSSNEGGTADPRDAYNDAREKLARLAEAEDAVRRDSEAPTPLTHVETPMGRKGDIITLAAESPDEPRLIDDDGTPLETPGEMDRRHREEHAAKVAEVLEGNPSPRACCPVDEVLPCSACLSHDGPADLSDDGWDDSHVWAPSDFPADPDDDDETFAAWLDHQADAYTKIGTPRASWLAGKIAKLAEQARWLDAATPDAFDDRLDAHLDCVQAEAEARAAARCN